MRKDELKIRRNFHVSKRITSRLERQYGIDLHHPFARDTVPSLIDSLKTPRNDARREYQPSPVETPSCSVRTTALDNRKAFLSSLKCVGEAAYDDCTTASRYSEWPQDDYLFLQLGPISSGTQKRSSPPRHQDCDEPECGTNDWYCDLCQEFDLTNEPMVLEETVAPSTLEAHVERQHEAPLPVFTLQDFINICPIVESIRKRRQSKTVPDLEDFFEPDLFSGGYDTHTYVPAPIKPTTMTPVKDKPDIPYRVCTDSIDDALFVLSLILSHKVDPTPLRSPGCDNAFGQFSVTRKQSFVFDRGKRCLCGTWFNQFSFDSHPVGTVIRSALPT